MPSKDDRRESKLSRRGFMKSAATLVVAGVVGLGLSGLVGSHRDSDASGAKETARPFPASPANPLSQNGQQDVASPFSIFWMTDTQFLSETNPALYRMVTKWIVDNWDTFNGRFVIHTGDIVQTGSNETEWTNANAAMKTLLDNGIPYTWCAGNHDDYANGDPSSNWIGYDYPAFSPRIVGPLMAKTGYATWVGDHHDAMNTAATFSANGLNFLVVNLEWKGQTDVLNWLEGLLDDPQYDGYRVIIAPHAYIDALGNLNDATWGPQLLNFVTPLTEIMDERSSSVFLTLNGHFASDCGYNTPTIVNGRNSLMFDRQDSTDAPGEPTGRGADDSNAPHQDRVGGSTVTILTFNVAANEISVKTFDVYEGKWRTGPTERYTVSMFADPLADVVTPQFQTAITTGN